MQPKQRGSGAKQTVRQTSRTGVATTAVEQQKVIIVQVFGGMTALEESRSEEENLVSRHVCD